MQEYPALDRLRLATLGAPFVYNTQLIEPARLPTSDERALMTTINGQMLICYVASSKIRTHWSGQDGRLLYLRRLLRHLHPQQLRQPIRWLD